MRRLEKIPTFGGQFFIRVLTGIVLLCLAVNCFGQDGIKFKVEELSRPEGLLYTTKQGEIYNKLILSDVDMSEPGADFPFGIVAQSDGSDNSIVSFGYHSFFNGMYQAYADHRPFVLSPDMVWLLISQGFARHVAANSESLRSKFVDFQGKTSLVVNGVGLDSPASAWEKVFAEFTSQIAGHVGNDLVNVLSSDFSTTTPIERVASEITIMEAMEPYFEFVVIYVICGIPEITLKGTPEDWQSIVERTRTLGKYNLSWWTSELEPILEEFVKASKGDIDQDFWRNMFKYHSRKKYGAPKIIDGWIVKFFPYDKDGKPNNLMELKGGSNLPEEIVKVDVKHIEMVDGTAKTTPLELWAGFIGLKQDPVNFTLTPQIGWMIRKKDVERVGLKQKLTADNGSEWGGIMIRVKEIPKEIYELKEIQSLEVYFIDRIMVPDKLKDVNIKILRLYGKIDKTETERIRTMFPNTDLVINGELVGGPSMNSASRNRR